MQSKNFQYKKKPYNKIRGAIYEVQIKKITNRCPRTLQFTKETDMQMHVLKSNIFFLLGVFFSTLQATLWKQRSILTVTPSTHKSASKTVFTSNSQTKLLHNLKPSQNPLYCAFFDIHLKKVLFYTYSKRYHTHIHVLLTSERLCWRTGFK